METLFIDNLLDFSSDIGEEEDGEEDENNHNNKAPFHSKSTNNNTQQHQQKAEFNLFDAEGSHRSLPVLLEEEEEELEWLLDKDIFPSIETFEILSEKPSNNGPKHQSPVSVLENNSSSSSCNSLRFPVKARSKKRRQRRSCFSDLSGQQWWWWCEPKMKKTKKKSVGAETTTRVRKCEHCLTEKTPQWRAGPLGPKTLCNACGVRYKSGRLVAEYRPANSPSFSSKLHSNSHRKILEMRRKKQKEMFQSFDKG